MDQLMTTLYLLSGIPGSGKTTLAHQLAEQHNAVVLSYDDMPGANTKASMDGSVKRAWLGAIRAELLAGKSVVCDGINLTAAERREVLAAVAGILCEKHLIVKAVPLETCLQRNAQRRARLPEFVITQSAEMFEPPQPGEGWDVIQSIRD